jgi:L-lactate dehydrogenase complex protein LldF
VHVAISGIDKVVPDMQSLSVLVKLLARSATGQKISTYTSFIRGPRQTAEENGPQEFHLILLDNGRTRILQDEGTRETMLCIRCGACLNVCPVYNHVGGHAYGWVYSGPIGSILSPQLLGTSVAADLPFASSLCGACGDVCPVRIPIPQILLHLRHRVVEGDQVEPAAAPPIIQTGMNAGTIAFGTPWLYQLGTLLLPLLQKPLRRGTWLPALPPPLDRWTMVRPFPAFGADIRAWWNKRSGRPQTPRWMRNAAILAITIEVTLVLIWLLTRKRGGKK